MVYIEDIKRLRGTRKDHGRQIKSCPFPSLQISSWVWLLDTAHSVGRMSPLGGGLTTKPQPGRGGWGEFFRSVWSPLPSWKHLTLQHSWKSGVTAFFVWHEHLLRPSEWKRCGRLRADEAASDGTVSKHWLKKPHLNSLPEMRTPKHCF